MVSTKTMVFTTKHFLIFSLVLIEIFGEKCESKNGQIKCDNETLDTKLEGFIVGGAKTIIEHFPHAVCLLHYPSYHFFCGSSVLNQRVLLTAAHCVEGDEEDFTMEGYAGHAHLGKATIIRKVNRFIRHERYDTVTVQYDIALLFLDDSEFPLGGNSPIKRVIIKKEFPHDTEIAEISGWGRVNDESTKTSVVLKWTDQKLIPLQECRKLAGWLPGMMCAGDADSDTNRPSNGDSGGGLMIKGFQQIGIVSFMLGDDPGLTFYTNVSNYYDWITKLVDDKMCPDTPENIKGEVKHINHTLESIKVEYEERIIQTNHTSASIEEN